MRLKLRYIEQRQAARRRDIPFLLSFDEWCQIWRQSGQLDNRGRSSDKFCMARIGDTGAYCVGNVRIITNHDNHVEAKLGKKFSSERIQRMIGSGNPHFGKKHTEATKKRIAFKVHKFWRGVPKTAEQKAKMSLARAAWWMRRKEADTFGNPEEVS